MSYQKELPMQPEVKGGIITRIRSYLEQPFARTDNRSGRLLLEAEKELIKAERVIAELVDAGRELHDFAVVDRHWNYEGTSRLAFERMATLLKRLEDR